jgi:hypothetical protein
LSNHDRDQLSTVAEATNLAALDNLFARKYTPDVGIITSANRGLNEITGTRS